MSDEHKTEADKLVKELDNISMELSGRAASVLSKAISLIQSQADKIERLEGVRELSESDWMTIETGLNHIASFETHVIAARQIDETLQRVKSRVAISRLTQEQS